MPLPNTFRILGTWGKKVDPAVRRVLLAGLVLALVGGAHLSRYGTGIARSISLAVLGGWVLVALGVLAWRAQRRRGPKAVVRLMTVVDRPLGLRIGRAQRLIADAKVRATATSEALASKHLARVLSRISVREVERRAHRRARWLTWVSLGAWLVAALLVAAEPLRVLEGWNVLLASKGRAPFTMKWIELERGTLYPPAYLRQSSHVIELDQALHEPRGTVVVVWGDAKVAERELLLTDGQQESPFVSDGAGRLTARLTCQKSGVLGVVVRFGNVRIWQASPLRLEVIEDHPPKVVLDAEGPTVDLTQQPRIALDYQVEDDHGIWQIDLRLRSGAIEERRLVTKLDGTRSSEQGALVIEAKDPFFERAYLPVSVTLMAKDNDAVDGPHWGESSAITVVVPQLGDKEVARVRAIALLKKGLVDWLALELAGQTADGVPPTDTERKEHLRGLSEQKNRLSEQANMPRGFLQLLSTQLARVERSIDGGARVEALTDALLFADSASETVGEQGAEVVARNLAGVGDELAQAARSVRLRETGRRKLPQVDRAVQILSSGGGQLARLGRLGKDLGEFVGSSMRRITRAQSAEKWAEVERASLFLSERLRHPTPAFNVRGSVGVESTKVAGSERRGRASELDTRFDRLSMEISQIVEAHRALIVHTTGLLRAVDQTPVPHGRMADIRAHAEQIRKLGRLLDTKAGAPSSPLLAIREACLKITDSLDRAMLIPATEQLSSTISTLRSLESNPTLPVMFLGIEPKHLSQVIRGLEVEAGWIGAEVESVRRLGSARLSSEYAALGERERELALRTEQIAARESAKDAVLPEEVQSDLSAAGGLMREAEGELLATRGSSALERQREAQRLLERSYVGRTFEDATDVSGSVAQSPDGREIPSGERVTITATSDAMGRETFRRMVQEGLGRGAPSELRDAVERYTEGLLR